MEIIPFSHRPVLCTPESRRSANRPRLAKSCRTAHLPSRPFLMQKSKVLHRRVGAKRPLGGCSLADDKALCDRARMRTPFLSLLVWGLASCASEPVHITADQCSSVSVGDEVQGTAVLYIASPFTFHVGPKVAGGPDCPSYQIQLANDVVSRAYGAIEQKEFPDDPSGGPIERMVTLSGKAVSGQTRGHPIIRITELRFSTATEP